MDTKHTYLYGGLLPTPRDPRDFPLGAVFDLPRPDQLPKRFELEPLAIYHQRESDYCTAHMSALMSSLQEGVALDPLYSFALSKEISGDPDAWGQDLRTAMKTHVKVGAIELSESPFALPGNGVPGKTEQDEFYLRKIENWPTELKAKAAKHKKQSFFAVTGRYDHFDNIRGAIHLFRNMNRAVGMGVLWGWSLNTVVMPDGAAAAGFGHAIPGTGWDEIEGQEVLTITNSYGLEAGKNGKHYFPRALINDMVRQYGAYMFVDMDPEEVKEYLNKQSWWRRLICRFTGFC